MTNFDKLTYEILEFILSCLRCSKFKHKFLQACKYTHQLYNSTQGRLAFRNFNTSGNPLLEHIHDFHRCLNGPCGPGTSHPESVHFLQFSAQCCFHPEVCEPIQLMPWNNTGNFGVRYVCCSAMCNRSLQQDIRNTHVTNVSYTKRGFCCNGYNQAEGATCRGCSKKVGKGKNFRTTVGPHVTFLYGAAGRTGPTGTQIEVPDIYNRHSDGDIIDIVQLGELVWITQPITFHVGIDLKHLQPANTQVFYDETLDPVISSSDNSRYMIFHQGPITPSIQYCPTDKGAPETSNLHESSFTTDDCCAGSNYHNVRKSEGSEEKDSSHPGRAESSCNTMRAGEEQEAGQDTPFHDMQLCPADHRTQEQERSAQEASEGPPEEARQLPKPQICTWGHC
jgi:hypothetical protein